MKGYTRAKDIDKALEIFEMMKLNPSIRPSTITFSVLIECCLQCHNYEKMEEIVKECFSKKDED